tara:strand:+ start:4480 stop:5394 length:915 start_codon:yes stop_codon:yes gene_type:complete
MILGIQGAFNTKAGFVFPTHEDFKLIQWKDRREYLGKPDAFIQSNILGRNKIIYADMYRYILEQKKPILVVEQATFRQNLDIDKEDYYYRVGRDCYTYNKGYFNNKDSKPDRWLQIQKEQNIEIKPWKKNGDYILLLLQNPVDTSLNDLVSRTSEYTDWIKNIIVKISEYTAEDIMVRLHPRFPLRFNLRELLKLKVRNNIIFSKNVGEAFNKSSSKDLYKDLDHARVAVSYSSNALVETVCEGIPTIALSKTSHAWPVSFHNLDVLKETTLPDKDRTQWLYDTAYTQWKMSEINTGEVHKRLL